MNLWGLVSKNKKLNSPTQEAQNMNFLTNLDYLNRMTLLALTVFEWKGLPESIPVRFLEKTLFSEGKCLFFKNDTNPADYVITKISSYGKLNMYQEPTSYIAITPEWSKRITTDKGVLIRNNYLSEPTFPTLTIFAYRMTNAERASDVNINAQKTPWIITGSKDQELTLKNLYKQIDENTAAIFGDDTIIDLNMLKVLNTNAPLVAPQLQLYIDGQWNKFMTFIGLDNANTAKKERMIVDEVNANNQQTQVSANAMLTTRQEAAAEISKMIGSKVTCDFRIKPAIENDRTFDDSEDNSNDEQ